MKRTTKKVFLAVAALMGFGMLSGELGTSVTGRAGLKGANTNSTGKKFYSAYSSMDEVGDAGNALTREIAGEGIVMLKNKDNLLPLEGVKNVTVFGKNSVNTSIGGGGSGASKGYYPAAGIYDTLKEAGFVVNEAQKAFYEDNSRSGNGRTSGGMFSSSGFTIGETPVSNYESSVKETWNTYNDAAIITIVRSGSEGADEPVCNIVDDASQLDANGSPKEEVGNRHYLELSKNEEDMIKMVEESGKFSKIIVVLNATNVMELGDLEKDDKIGAMLWTGGLGGTGFYAIGDILTGKVNPSGKTVDVFPADLLNDPTSLNFGTNAQNQDNNVENYFLSPDKQDANFESKYKDIWYGKNRDGSYSTTETASIAAYTNYEEGVYLGYKYYETMFTVKGGLASRGAKDWYAQNVVYPFGFGLSFTEFEMKADGEIQRNGHDMSLDVKVTNKGAVAGKKTVELYVEAPYTDGQVEKPSAVLVAFAKTDTIKPGQNETVTLTWKDTDVASYDYNDANENGFKGYELDAGEYTFNIGDDSHNYQANVQWEVETTETFTTDGYTNNEVHNLFSEKIAKNNREDTTTNNPYRSLPMEGDGLVVEQLSRAKGKDLANINKPKEHGNAESTVKGDALKIMSEVVTGVNMEGTDNVASYMPSVDKKTVKEVKEAFGDDYTQGDTSVTEDFYSLAGHDPYTNEADKALYNRVINKMSWKDLYTALDGCGWKNAAIASINKPQSVDVDGPSAIYRVDYPTACTLAATFNIELAEKFGELIGEESLWGIRPGWYGPAMDTHRSAFSGRNFEYYSEDGLLGGLIGAYSIKAAQAKGCYAFMKHMALNDCETDRNGNHAFVSEQALREIYFKPFRLSVEIGGALAVMGGMNSIGYVANYDNKAEMTDMLRGEWGFKGFVETDAGSFNYGTSPYSNGFMARVAGCDTLLGFGGKPSGLGAWDATKKVPVQDGKELWSIYYYFRQSMVKLLYVTANSSVTQNGLNFKNWDAENSTFNVACDTTANVSVKATDAANIGTTDVWYEITSGSLPEGVTMDRYGAITGKPTKKGSYKFTVTMHADGWITHTKDYTFNVIDAFKIDKTEAKANEEFDATISSDYITEGTITYMDEEGTLPEGLELSADGHITGKATKNGTYTVKIHVIQVVEVPNGWWGTRKQSYEYDQEFTLTVTGATEVKPVTADEAKAAADAAKTAADAAKAAADAAKTAADAAQKTAAEAKTAATTTSKGCGGSIIAASSALGAMALLGVALAFKKKREED